MKKIDVMVPGSRGKFELWIKERGGVQVWHNLNLSNPGAGNQFTPATMVITKDELKDYPGLGIGSPVMYPKPHWSVGAGEVVTDIARFRFVKSFKELKRIRVALRRGAQGLIFKLTDGSQRKVDRALDKAREKYGEAYYRKDGGLFDYERFIVIEVPEWEDV